MGATTIENKVGGRVNTDNEPGDGPASKRCSRKNGCGITKPTTEFYKSQLKDMPDGTRVRTGDGFKSQCKTCMNQKAQEARAKRGLGTRKRRNRDLDANTWQCMTCSSQEPESWLPADSFYAGRNGKPRPHCKGCTKGRDKKYIRSTGVKKKYIRPSDPVAQTKSCKDCSNDDDPSTWKPWADFRKNGNTKDGLDIRCRECAKTRDRQYLGEKEGVARGVHFNPKTEQKYCWTCRNWKHLRMFDESAVPNESGRQRVCRRCKTKGKDEQD